MEGAINVMGKYVYYEETPYNKGKYILALHHDESPFQNGTSGSYNVFLARIAGLSYADFLRMCRDEFGAEIIGKDKLYPVAYFNRSKELDALIDNLNARANLIIWEREHPNYKEHEKYVKEKNPRFYEEVINNVSNTPRT